MSLAVAVDHSESRAEGVRHRRERRAAPDVRQRECVVVCPVNPQHRAFGGMQVNAWVPERGPTGEGFPVGVFQPERIFVDEPAAVDRRDVCEARVCGGEDARKKTAPRHAGAPYGS